MTQQADRLSNIEIVSITQQEGNVEVAELIDDCSTLQMGIGTIPDAVLKCLHNHKNLGVHTEMLSDGIIDLVAKDIINNKYKRYTPQP